MRLGGQGAPLLEASSITRRTKARSVGGRIERYSKALGHLSAPCLRRLLPFPSEKRAQRAGLYHSDEASYSHDAAPRTPPLEKKPAYGVRRLRSRGWQARTRSLRR